MTWTPSTPSLPPGSGRPTPTSARSTGSSPPPTPASNSATYTQTLRGDGLLAAELELFCSCPEVLGGDGEALQSAVGGVLMLNVDRHVGIDLGEGAQEIGPVVDVVAHADGNEPPGGIVRPGGAPEPDAGRNLVGSVGRDVPEGGVEHAADVHPGGGHGRLGRGGGHQRAPPPD